MEHFSFLSRAPVFQIFSTLDIDSDGDVTEDEFVNGCLQVKRPHLNFSNLKCPLIFKRLDNKFFTKDLELVEALNENKTRPPLALPSSESTPRRKSSR